MNCAIFYLHALILKKKMKKVFCGLILCGNSIHFADANSLVLDQIHPSVMEYPDYSINYTLENDQDFNAKIDQHEASYFQLALEQEQAEQVEVEQYDSWTDSSAIQKKLAEEHDKELNHYSILSNKFYEDERIKVFNYTAYDTQQLKNSLVNPQMTGAEANQLYLSFGYGMEFKINVLNKVGYEYLSSFPYDRGQLIRFYWVHTLVH